MRGLKLGYTVKSVHMHAILLVAQKLGTVHKRRVLESSQHQMVCRHPTNTESRVEGKASLQGTTVGTCNMVASPDRQNTRASTATETWSFACL